MPASSRLYMTVHTPDDPRETIRQLQWLFACLIRAPFEISITLRPQHPPPAEDPHRG
jgi:hypothetical protein